MSSAAIDELIGGAVAGRGGLLHLRGARAWQSSLIRAGAEMAERSGVRVLSGRAPELERDTALGLATQALAPLISNGSTTVEPAGGVAALALGCCSVGVGALSCFARRGAAYPRGLI